MARASLIFRYQWRAFWRRVLRTRRLEFYLPVLTLLGGVAVVALPERLSRAGRELVSGQTASMDALLVMLGLLWLAVLSEELHVSLSTDRLRRFPVDVRSLFALRLLSVVLSPIAWLATIVSLIGLSPLLAAAHPMLGVLAALCFLALAIGVGVSVSQALGRSRWGRRLLVGVAAFGAAAGAIALASAPRAAVANPAMLVTTIAVATTPYAIGVASGDFAGQRRRRLASRTLELCSKPLW